MQLDDTARHNNTDFCPLYHHGVLSGNFSVVLLLRFCSEWLVGSSWHVMVLAEAVLAFTHPKL